MKHLKKFETVAQYNAAKDNLVLPNVSLITETVYVVYKPYVEPKNIIKYKGTIYLLAVVPYFE